MLLLLSKHFTIIKSKLIDFYHSLNINQRWKQGATTTAGGHGQGNQLNQPFDPRGAFIDDDQTIYVADTGNHRIVEWKKMQSMVKL
jgi:hypothetical protein